MGEVSDIVKEHVGDEVITGLREGLGVRLTEEGAEAFDEEPESKRRKLRKVAVEGKEVEVEGSRGGGGTTGTASCAYGAATNRWLGSVGRLAW